MGALGRDAGAPSFAALLRIVEANARCFGFKALALAASVAAVWRGSDIDFSVIVDATMTGSGADATTTGLGAGAATTGSGAGGAIIGLA
ncbi:MAG: hypothetical protein AMJ72_09995, partial [Acidithiobacillales bacterium SM1_46]